MKNYLKILILYTIVLVSCQKELEINNLGEYENKIVLNGLIYAGSSGIVNVGKSIGILNTEGKPLMLENASVTMMNSNNQSFAFQYDSLGDYSLKNNNFNAGETYDFTARSDGYSAVSASVTIPPKTTIVSVDTSTFYGISPDCANCSKEEVFKLTMNLKSTTSEKEYFMVSLLDIDTIKYDFIFREEDGVSKIDTVRLDPPRIFKKELWLYSHNPGLKLTYSPGVGLGEVFNDGYSYDGHELYFEKPEGETDYSITIYDYNFYSGGNKNILTLFFTVVSEDFYKHQLSIARANYAAGDFIAEKVSIYSNVKDGLGIMAGANQTIEHIEFPE
jgi:hypothetical protein